jgi:cytosine/adenosine deaminase-related metal-dependent hydrolase
MTGNILGTARSHFLRRNGNIHDPQDMLFRYPAEITARYFPGYGTLKAGGKADIAVTNYRPVTPVHTGNLFYHIVFGVQGKEMYMTVSGGKVVFSDNTLHTVDETAVNREISRTVKKLYKTYGD